MLSKFHFFFCTISSSSLIALLAVCFGFNFNAKKNQAASYVKNLRGIVCLYKIFGLTFLKKSKLHLCENEKWENNVFLKVVLCNFIFSPIAKSRR